MAFAREWSPGEIAEVWVHDKGSDTKRLRGDIVIEDLTMTLRRISARTGANGPQSPVTQFILAAAAEHLAARLIDDVQSRDGREPLPRMLSGSLGHQPFIESVLGMSQHQMLRRWPLANDWYADVVSYILRPVRFAATEEIIRNELPTWLTLPFGEVVRRFAIEHLVVRGDQRIFRVAEAIQALWPDYEPVRASQRQYRESVHTHWEPVFAAIMQAYDLHLGPGVSLAEASWAFNAVHWREVQERLADPERALYSVRPGTEWTWSGRAGLMVCAGAVVTADGRPLTADELAVRPPAARDSRATQPLVDAGLL